MATEFWLSGGRQERSCPYVLKLGLNPGHYITAKQKHCLSFRFYSACKPKYSNIMLCIFRVKLKLSYNLFQFYSITLYKQTCHWVYWLVHPSDSIMYSLLEFAWRRHNKHSNSRLIFTAYSEQEPFSDTTTIFVYTRTGKYVCFIHLTKNSNRYVNRHSKTTQKNSKLYRWVWISNSIFSVLMI